MESRVDRLGATKSESSLLVLFILSADRDDQPIDHTIWVTLALKVLGTLFGGATAFPKGRGVWRDDSRGGRLVFDEPTVIQCYTNENAIEEQLTTLRDFLRQLGRDTNQGAVGVLV